MNLPSHPATTLRLNFLIAGFFCAALLSSIPGSSQTAPGKYWIQFTDKDNSPYSTSHPEGFLSAECIQRREKFDIPFDAKDIPVKDEYIEAVLSLGDCVVANRSKWFNAITIYTTDTLLIESIAALPFVSETRSVSVVYQGDKEKFCLTPYRENKSIEDYDENNSSHYGPSFRQIEMLNGQVMHELGFTGKGIRIALLDAGWHMTDVLPAFDRLRSNGQLMGVRDFVNGGNSVYNMSNHGSYVLSLMAGFIPDSLIGTAPDALYWLFRTEDAPSEYVVEEDNWVAAAEVCDSLGIDIINSSLGYSLFDDSLINHTYADMDGNSTRISIAADIAAAKGILVVNSAGNSGDDPWHFITAPSDGDSVLCVGAVDASRLHAPFSSYGPSADGDVKPNVCAMGLAAVIADMDSTVRVGNGTSFSSPIMAGMAACLMQSHPEKNNMEIFRAIEQSADLYPFYNDSLGYGIPDFYRAFLTLQSNPFESGESGVSLYPNPCDQYVDITLQSHRPGEVRFTVFDSRGRIVIEDCGLVSGNGVAAKRWDFNDDFQPGVYLLRVQDEAQEVLLKLVKK